MGGESGRAVGVDISIVVGAAELVVLLILRRAVRVPRAAQHAVLPLTLGYAGCLIVGVEVPSHPTD
jgi:hypothetical protein